MIKLYDFKRAKNYRSLFILYLHLIFMKFNINWDRLGISAALICAIHCAIFPLLSTGFPFLFAYFGKHNFLFDSIMILISFFIGIFNLNHGKKKHHHKYLPLIIFTMGILILIIRFFVLPKYEIFFVLVGASCIIYAHIINYRFCRQHNHLHEDDCNHS